MTEENNVNNSNTGTGGTNLSIQPLSFDREKVLIVQCDTRLELDFLGLSKKANRQKCNYLNEFYLKIKRETHKYQYEYRFYHMCDSENENNGQHNVEYDDWNRYYAKTFVDLTNNNPASAKVFFINNLLKTFETKVKFIVFIDSDAWIQNPVHLHTIVQHLNATPHLHGAYSRDPYLIKNTFINSGVFILKVNEFTRQMYKEIVADYKAHPESHTSWPYDQLAVSNAVHKYRDFFLIFKPDVLNTPNGKVLRHNWWKNLKMFQDLYDNLNTNIPFIIPEELNIAGELDNAEYPNTTDDTSYNFVT